VAESPTGHRVRIVEVEAIPTLVIAEETTWELFPTRWPELLGEVWAFVRAQKLDAGRNVMLYRDDGPCVEVGVESRARPEPSGRIARSALPAGRAAFTVARGAPADALGLAHDAVVSWCKANEHRLSGCRWEIYDHWRDDQDPASFETEVYWLLD
jgi:effector-binding domain-containing protein